MKLRGGAEYADLGHAYAKSFAMRFLQNMLDRADNVFAGQFGFSGATYRQGFLRRLEFFHKYPAYRGKQ